MSLGDIIRRRERRSEAWGTVSGGGTGEVESGGHHQEEGAEEWSLGDIILKRERRSQACGILSGGGS